MGQGVLRGRLGRPGGRQVTCHRIRCKGRPRGDQRPCASERRTRGPDWVPCGVSGSLLFPCVGDGVAGETRLESFEGRGNRVGSVSGGSPHLRVAFLTPGSGPVVLLLFSFPPRGAHVVSFAFWRMLTQLILQAFVHTINDVCLCIPFFKGCNIHVFYLPSICQTASRNICLVQYV